MNEYVKAEIASNDSNWVHVGWGHYINTSFVMNLYITPIYTVSGLFKGYFIDGKLYTHGHDLLDGPILDVIRGKDD